MQMISAAVIAQKSSTLRRTTTCVTGFDGVKHYESSSCEEAHMYVLISSESTDAVGQKTLNRCQWCNMDEPLCTCSVVDELLRGPSCSSEACYMLTGSTTSPKGRSLQAARDIQMGQLIFLEEAYILVAKGRLIKSELCDVCHACSATSCRDLVVCPRCRRVAFCSGDEHTCKEQHEGSMLCGAMCLVARINNNELNIDRDLLEATLKYLLMQLRRKQQRDEVRIDTTSTYNTTGQDTGASAESGPPDECGHNCGILVKDSSRNLSDGVGNRILHASHKDAAELMSQFDQHDNETVDDTHAEPEEAFAGNEDHVDNISSSSSGAVNLNKQQQQQQQQQLKEGLAAVFDKFIQYVAEEEEIIRLLTPSEKGEMTPNATRATTTPTTVCSHTTSHTTSHHTTGTPLFDSVNAGIIKDGKLFGVFDKTDFIRAAGVVNANAHIVTATPIENSASYTRRRASHQSGSVSSKAGDDIGAVQGHFLSEPGSGDVKFSNECEQVLFGLFPLLAMMNHSCRSNCTFVGTGISSNIGVMQVRACRDIAAGEELTVNYIGDKVYLDKEERQRFVQTTRGFRCLCDYCSRCSCAGRDDFVDDCVDDDSEDNQEQLTSNDQGQEVGQQQQQQQQQLDALEKALSIVCSSPKRWSINGDDETMLVSMTTDEPPDVSSTIKSLAVALSPFLSNSSNSSSCSSTYCSVSDKNLDIHYDYDHHVKTSKDEIENTTITGGTATEECDYNRGRDRGSADRVTGGGGGGGASRLVVTLQEQERISSSCYLAAKYLAARHKKHKNLPEYLTYQKHLLQRVCASLNGAYSLDATLQARDFAEISLQLTRSLNKENNPLAMGIITEGIHWQEYAVRGLSVCLGIYHPLTRLAHRQLQRLEHCKNRLPDHHFKSP